jgi:hypothetical protein
MEITVSSDCSYRSMSPRKCLPTSAQCRSLAKKVCDVVSFLSGLGLVGAGVVWMVGEPAGVSPNRGAGFGMCALGAVIARPNYVQIRNWWN